jgi:hypothetical protein
MAHQIEFTAEARNQPHGHSGRVYHEVSERPVPYVTIRAIGVKLRERVLVGGMEVDLS